MRWNAIKGTFKNEIHKVIWRMVLTSLGTGLDSDCPEVRVLRHELTDLTGSCSRSTVSMPKTSTRNIHYVAMHDSEIMILLPPPRMLELQVCTTSFSLCRLGMEPRVSCVLGKHSPLRLTLSPLI